MWIAGILNIKGIFSSSSTADATSTTTGSINTAGGMGIVKALWVGGLANIAGVLTAADNLKIGTVGKGIYIKEGSNATMGAATLSAGAVTINTTKVTGDSRIILTIQSLGTVTVPKAIGVTARTAGTSFTVTSSDATDTSIIAWQIVEPA